MDTEQVGYSYDGVGRLITMGYGFPDSKSVRSKRAISASFSGQMESASAQWRYPVMRS